MVKRLLSAFLLLPYFLFSAEFTANVSRNQITLGENITLTLTLKEATAKAPPSTNPLKQAFVIATQQQSSSIVNVNGKVSSSTTWRITLIPQKEGEAIIPSISIDTNAGPFSSQPLAIQVAKASAAKGSDAFDKNGMTFSTTVSTPNPYKNEPVIYTIILSSRRELANIRMPKPTIDDAIVETVSEPKIYDKIVNGVKAGYIEFSYIITPLKAGALTIPPNVLQGSMPERRKSQIESLFDDNFDPLSMLQGFERLTPFALTSEEIVLNVQPPVASVTPWLPAKSLKIEEVWNPSQNLQVGEPFTRSFKITAEGVMASQLPNLNDLQISDKFFRIYADKPEMESQVKDGNIKSQRHEQYTLIPQQAGSLTLPEIIVAWWDVTKNEKVVASIPSRTLQILPAAESSVKGHDDSPPETAPATSAAPQAADSQWHPLLYAAIAGLVLLLAVAITWGLMLQRKIANLKKSQGNKAATSKKEKLPDLNPT